MKKIIPLFVVLLSLALPGAIQAQSTFRYGGEIGLSVSQLPQRQSQITGSGLGKVNESTNPLLGPLVGLTTELTVKRYIRFTMGAQYQLAGERYYAQRRDRDLIQNTDYTFEVWENSTFHKLALPFSAGFILPNWKLQPSLFIGYRPNFFISGEENSKSIYARENQGEVGRDKNSFDPFDTASSAKRFQHQVFIGLSSSLSEHVKLSFTYHAGGLLLYSEHHPYGYLHDYNNNDWIISVAYLLQAKKKH